MQTVKEHYIKQLQNYTKQPNSAYKVLAKKLIKNLHHARTLEDLNLVLNRDVKTINSDDILFIQLQNFKNEIMERMNFDLAKIKEDISQYHADSRIHVKSFIKLLEKIIDNPLHLFHLSASQLWREFQKIELQQLFSYLNILPIKTSHLPLQGISHENLRSNHTEVNHCKVLLHSNNNSNKNNPEKIHLNIILQSLIKIYYDLEQEKKSLFYNFKVCLPKQGRTLTF